MDRHFSGSLAIAALLALSTAVHAPASEQRKLPVDGGTVTSGIGWRPDPFGSGRMLFHRGIDISVPSGTPVYPTQDGYVFYAGPYGAYGTAVAIAHGSGYLTLYGHNSKALVQPGQWVDTKTVIALSGNTGRSTGPHVHYEVRQHQGKDRVRQDQVIQAMKENIEAGMDALARNPLPPPGTDEGV